jgi:hypothetical protein
MPSKIGISHKDYYELLPTLGNRPGDIWSGLPTFGFLGNTSNSGIVITPACDLSNRKVETITYLPIISLHSYFITSSFIPEITKKICGQLQSVDLLSLCQLINEKPGRYSLPNNDHLNELYCGIKLCKSKNILAIQRVEAGIRTLQRIKGLEPTDATKLTNDVKLLLGEHDFRVIVERIINNSYRQDLHFLPSDEQNIAYSGLPNHSIALFRYAFSAPVEIFEAAQDLNISDWTAFVNKLSMDIPGTSVFSLLQPIKKLRLKSIFLADLITRYTAMYARLGSPDFPPHAVREFIDQIEGL